MKLLSPNSWKDYELIDTGDREKLERFGRFVLRRPEPQAVWGKSQNEATWNSADATFQQEGSSSGKWLKKNSDMPDSWNIRYENGNLKIRFRLALTGFKHVGVFPEQAVNWDYIYQHSRRLKNPKVLNLFAYTGGASLAARATGADVIHCDSIKQVVSWANKNMLLSKQSDIRWLVEDAFKFVRKEAKRGNIYQGIIMDPPAWGHGPKGEKWKLETHIDELMSNVSRILDEKQGFLVFNSYSLGFSSLVLRNLIQSHFTKGESKRTEIGELYLPEHSKKMLPAGVFARFSNN